MTKPVEELRSKVDEMTVALTTILLELSARNVPNGMFDKHITKSRQVAREALGMVYP